MPLSAKLAAAVNGQLDAAQAQLEQTRSQLLEARPPSARRRKTP